MNNLPIPAWYHVASLGEHPHQPSGLVQIIDPAAVATMASRGPSTRPGLLVDYDHLSYDPTRPSEAAGWITALEARSDGLWARIRWTPDGAAAVREGRYRFLSPVFMPADLESLGGNRVRPLRLEGAGLTNHPNLGGLTPLANRAAQPSGATPGAATKGNPMPTIREVLGLPPDAAEDAVFHAAQSLRDQCTQLENACRALRETQAETDLDRLANRFEPAAREHWRAALLANREQTLTLLESLRPAPALPLHRPDNPAVPPGLPPGPPQIAARQRAEILAYRNRHGGSFQDAWKALKATQPTLFPSSAGGRPAGAGSF